MRDGLRLQSAGSSSLEVGAVSARSRLAGQCCQSKVQCHANREDRRGRLVVLQTVSERSQREDCYEVGVYLTIIGVNQVLLDAGLIVGAGGCGHCCAREVQMTSSEREKAAGRIVPEAGAMKTRSRRVVYRESESLDGWITCAAGRVACVEPGRCHSLRVHSSHFRDTADHPAAEQPARPACFRGRPSSTLDSAVSLQLTTANHTSTGSLLWHHRP